MRSYEGGKWHRRSFRNTKQENMLHQIRTSKQVSHSNRQQHGQSWRNVMSDLLAAVPIHIYPHAANTPTLSPNSYMHKWDFSQILISYRNINILLYWRLTKVTAASSLKIVFTSIQVKFCTFLWAQGNTLDELHHFLSSCCSSSLTSGPDGTAHHY